MASWGVIDDQMEDMEEGGGCEEGILMARLVVDEETEMDQHQPSSIDDVESIRRDDVKPNKNAVKIALAVAATAAVQLTNLSFLHGDTERQRRHRCCKAGLTALEALAVLFAFAAFLLSASVLLLRRTAQRHLMIASAERSGVLLAASTASLFVASTGMAFSLLHTQGFLQFGASRPP